MKDIRQEKRNEIATIVNNEIKKQKIPIEQIEKKSVSKRIIYNIIQGKGYTINSLISVGEVLKERNKQFKITI